MIDGNNTVANAGPIHISDADGATVILATAGVQSTVTNTGKIIIQEGTLARVSLEDVMTEAHNSMEVDRSAWRPEHRLQMGSVRKLALMRQDTAMFGGGHLGPVRIMLESQSYF